MNTVSVFPESGNSRPQMYRAIAGDREGIGPTVGDAVNAVTAAVGGPGETTLVIVQPMRPDRFVSAVQIQRLQELMTKWRVALDPGTALPADEQAGLDTLVQAELEAFIERTKALSTPRPTGIHRGLPAGRWAPRMLPRPRPLTTASSRWTIHPRGSGRADDPADLALAYPACNRPKRHRLAEWDEEAERTAPLFHPRTDQRADRLRLDEKAGLIVPLTATGRVTVAILDLNHPRQVVARLLWIAHRLYP